MDRKTLLAIAICFLIFFGWQKLYIEPRQPKPQAPVSQTTQPAPTGTAAVAPGQPAAPQATTQAVAPSELKSETPKQVPFETKSFEVSTGTVSISNANTVLHDWVLKGYRQGKEASSAPTDLRTIAHGEGEGQLAFDLPEYAYLANVRGTLEVNGTQSTWRYDDQNVTITRTTVAQPGQPAVDVTINAQFKGKKPGFAFVSVATKTTEKDPEAQDRQLQYWSNKSVERVVVKDDVKLAESPGSAKWVVASSRYFLTALVPQGLEPKALVQPINPTAARVSLVYPVTGNSITIPMRAFFGPKDLDVLRAVEPSLDHTVDFGWFTVIAYPLLKLMKWFYHAVFQNWGVSIILLTLLVKIVTYPLTWKSMKSMKEMARLQPQLTKIREKHKDDKEALNREMLSIMKSHGYNPMAGCLPILIQMPVFFALYRVLYGSIELYHSPFMFWIQDLSAKDPYYVTPVLLSGLMYLQQKMTPTTATDPVQAKMMQFMPLIFGAFMLTLPAGLTLYMLVNSIASIVQQLYMNRKLDGRYVTAPARAK